MGWDLPFMLFNTGYFLKIFVNGLSTILTCHSFKCSRKTHYIKLVNISSKPNDRIRLYQSVARFF